jgi:hypothetical protein
MRSDFLGVLYEVFFYKCGANMLMENRLSDSHSLVTDYRMIKKSLCTWWLRYKKTQKYFKQFQSLTMITYLELVISDVFIVSIVSPWPWRSAAKQSDWACFLYCNHQVDRDFLITLCNTVSYRVVRRRGLFPQNKDMYIQNGIARPKEGTSTEINCTGSDV